MAALPAWEAAKRIQPDEARSVLLSDFGSQENQHHLGVGRREAVEMRMADYFELTYRNASPRRAWTAHATRFFQIMLWLEQNQYRLRSDRLLRRGADCEVLVNTALLETLTTAPFNQVDTSDSGWPFTFDYVLMVRLSRRAVGFTWAPLCLGY
jgi:hypothetical protein